MKKQILSILFIAAGLTSFAQVGVGTELPTTTLHVAAPAGLTTATGVTIPVVTDDMTTTAVNGMEVSQLVYSSHANSTGYYYWDGSAWGALGGTASLNYTATADPSYAIQASDDIIEYTNNAVANGFSFPSTVPAGKIFYIISTGGSNGQITIGSVVTDGAKTINGTTGGAFMHLGSGRYAAIHSY